MNWFVGMIVQLYSRLLRLYPAGFRDQFADEMTAVFAQTVMEASERGLGVFTAVCLRECRDLAFNLAQEQWQSLTKREIPMTTIPKKPGWSFYPSWVVLTTLSIPLAFGIILLIIPQIVKVVGDTIVVNGRTRITEDWIGMILFIPVMGLVSGLLQYLMLRRYLPRMGWWVVATALAWPLAAVGLYFMSLFHLDTNDYWFGLLVTLVIGGAIGLMQWLVLRQHVPHSGWWVPATVVGWLAVGLATGNRSGGPLNVWYVIALPAIIAAITLGLLLKQATPKLSRA